MFNTCKCLSEFIIALSGYDSLFKVSFVLSMVIVIEEYKFPMDTTNWPVGHYDIGSDQN
jgi:hypothetical protein